MKTPCHKCNRETETAYSHLASGHIGQSCAVCGYYRLGAPYITKRKYFKLIELKIIPVTGTPKIKGEYHATSHR